MPSQERTTESPWEKFETFRERSKTDPSCYLHTFIHTSCSTQEGPSAGLPKRKCQRLIERFEDCGRGLQELGTSREETEDVDFSSTSMSHENCGGNCSVSGQVAPLDSNVGKAIEEFREYAEELKYRTAGVSLKRGPIFGGNYSEAPQAPLPLPVPWYSRLFHRQAECSPGRQRPWERYKKDFHDV